MPRSRRYDIFVLFTLLLVGWLAVIIASDRVSAQDAGEPLHPGEGFVTRFSGVSDETGQTILDVNGTVGSIVDLRNPAQPPKGQHWVNEPQRNSILAGQVGQVFGVAIDDAEQPNIYLTATSAFGLHRTKDNSDWMEGMWGLKAGPGAVWKLDATRGYAPQLFSSITFKGRQNTGASLGNIAYDRWNKQLYISDLETGMIHRLSLDDGTDLGHYDHGLTGRASFFDTISGQQKSLPKQAFDTRSKAQIIKCASGEFSRNAACWNYADFRRRVWGLGVRKDPKSGEVRLYYSTWSAQGFGTPEFAGARTQEKQNALWSIEIHENGSFNKASIKREFILPYFFTSHADTKRASKSHPVTDIAFPKCSNAPIMLVSERGGVRNLGLKAKNPFTNPHESRVLRYELDIDGSWKITGRYDVGYYDRKKRNSPYMRANSCGGVDFGYGYQQDWSLDPNKPDQFVWMNGDGLCAPNGPCFVSETEQRVDGSHVHGSQGTPLAGFDDVLPPAALQSYPPTGSPYPPTGITQSYLIDSDDNIDVDGTVLMSSLKRNHATMIGDIEIYQRCDGAQPSDDDEPSMEGPPIVDEPPVVDEPPIIEEPPVVDAPPVVDELPPVISGPPLDEGPDLETAKSGPTQCTEGDICTFTITVTNNGPGTWSGPLWEMDTLPPSGVMIDYRSQPNWLCTQNGSTQNVICEHSFVTLATGGSVSLEMDVLIPFGTAGQILTNCVEGMWLPSNDPSDPAAIQTIEQALAGSGYMVGTIDGVLDIVTQNAISQFQFDNGLLPTGLPDSALMDLLFPGASGQPGDANPLNDADCHSVEIIPIPAPAPAPSPSSQPDLMVRKIQTSGACKPGKICSFRLLYVNRGPGNWHGDLELVDTLPAGSSLISPKRSCTQSGNSVTCSYPQTITLPPNVPGWVSLRVRMPTNLKPGAKNCVQLSPSSAANDPNSGNNRHCIPIRVASNPKPDIEVYKEQKTQCAPGGECDFDLWFINRGPGVWSQNIHLADRLPKGVKLVRASKPWSCSQSNIYLACRRPSQRLNPGRSTRVRVTLRMPQNLEKDALNCVRVMLPASMGSDPVQQNDEHCIPIKTSAPSATDIAVEKRQVGTCIPGGICKFELKFINKGPELWTGTPRIMESLPSTDTTINSWSPSEWTLTQASTFEYQRVSIPVGGYVSLHVGLLIPKHAFEEQAAENCVSIDPVLMVQKDSNPDNNQHCIPIETSEPDKPAPGPKPVHNTDIKIEKMLAPYNPAGDEGGCETGCIIRLIVTNVGSTPWSGPLTVRDISLPPGTNIVRGMAFSLAQPGWSCDESGRCTNPSVTLQPGEGAVLDFYVTLFDYTGNNWNNCAVIENSNDENHRNNRHCIDIPVQPTPPVIDVQDPAGPGNIAIDKTQNGICKPSSICRFTIKFTNTGSTTWNGYPQISDVITVGGARLSDWAPNTWRCEKKDVSTDCRSGQVDLPPGESVFVDLNFQMPESLTSGAQNCAIRTGEEDASSWDDRKCIAIRTPDPEPEFAPRPPTIIKPQHRCPRGTYKRGKKCIRPPTRIHCPTGYYRKGKKCVTKPPTIIRCPRGTIRKGRKCIRPPRIVRCARGSYRRGNKCVRPPRIRRCPRGTYRRGNRCYRPPARRHCPRGMTRIGSICVNVAGAIGAIGGIINRTQRGRGRERPNCPHGDC
ncbi:MAG: DUF11 domain-containing protein [bacterium]|nr:DUF11 domain-containing protein [bacterium]